MEPSLEIKTVLNRHAKEFVKIVPISELIDDLRRSHIIKDEDIKEINELNLSRYLLALLLNHRGNRDFYNLCSLLQRHYDNAVKQFGEKLKREASGNIKINSYKINYYELISSL